MKILRIISRSLIGLVFVFSGTVKAIDPLGSVYKFNEYFSAFHLDFLSPFSLLISIVLFSAEFISGFSVLSGYRQKTGIWGILLLMIFFTPLTLLSAITNPVSDCGCFGDAIHLTNWQTFGKNIFLLILSIILFTGRKETKQLCKPVKEWMIISMVALLFITFSFLNLKYLPLLDFLPYKKGVNIPASMRIPEGKPVDDYRTTFIYEKEGVRKEFTIDDYPANDSSWKFIDQRSVLIKKGFKPPIHDFRISSDMGENLTDMILADTGYSVLMISTRLNDADPVNLDKGFELGRKCTTENIGFYVLTSSGTDELKAFDKGLKMCIADETTLKTMIRTNPGYILLKDGTIQAKWSWATLPQQEKLISEMNSEHIGIMNNKRRVLVVYTIIYSVLIMGLLINSLYRCFKARNEK